MKFKKSTMKTFYWSLNTKLFYLTKPFKLYTYMETVNVDDVKKLPSVLLYKILNGEKTLNILNNLTFLKLVTLEKQKRISTP